MGITDSDIMSPITEAFIEGYEALEEASMTLGMSMIDFSSISDDWIVSIDELNFAGKSQEEAAELINGAIGDQMDGWAETLAPLAGYVEDFKTAGEGNSETIIRLANDYEVMTRELGKMGITMDAVGAGGLRMAEGLIAAADGIDDLVSKLDYFYSNFYTEEEQIAMKTEILRAEFTRLGIVMPTTTLGFRALVEAQMEEIKMLSNSITAMELKAEAEWQYAISTLAAGSALLQAAEIAYNAVMDIIAEKKDELDILLADNDALLDLGSMFIDVYGTAEDAADALEKVYASLSDIASLQGAWLDSSVDAAQLYLDAIRKETGIYNVDYDNFLASFNAALDADGTMEQEQFDEWSQLSSALQTLNDAMNELLQIELDSLTSQVSFYDDILNRIQDAYTGSLSYLNDIEKADYLTQQADAYLLTGDIPNYLDTLAEQLEYEKAISVTKEDYVPLFDEYINSLQTAEYEAEATTDDVVEQIQITNEKLDSLADAIEQSSYQS